MAKPSRKRHLLTIHDLRESLPVSRARIYQLISTGELESVRIGKRVFVADDALERFLDDHSQRA